MPSYGILQLVFVSDCLLLTLCHAWPAYQINQFDHVCAVNSVCPKHMTRCAVGYVGLYSVSDTNGHENDCCTALTL